MSTEMTLTNTTITTELSSGSDTTNITELALSRTFSRDLSPAEKAAGLVHTPQLKAEMIKQNPRILSGVAKAADDFKAFLADPERDPRSSVAIQGYPWELRRKTKRSEQNSHSTILYGTQVWGVYDTRLPEGEKRDNRVDHVWVYDPSADPGEKHYLLRVKHGDPLPAENSQSKVHCWLAHAYIPSGLELKVAFREEAGTWRPKLGFLFDHLTFQVTAGNSEIPVRAWDLVQGDKLDDLFVVQDGKHIADTRSYVVSNFKEIAEFTNREEIAKAEEAKQAAELSAKAEADKKAAKLLRETLNRIKNDFAADIEKCQRKAEELARQAMVKYSTEGLELSEEAMIFCAFTPSLYSYIVENWERVYVPGVEPRKLIANAFSELVPNEVMVHGRD